MGRANSGKIAIAIASTMLLLGLVAAAGCQEQNSGSTSSTGSGAGATSSTMNMGSQAMTSASPQTAAVSLSPVQSLGKKLYFDDHLSTPDGKSCASCHAPEAGWEDPDHSLPVSAGAVEGRLGNRNSPAAAYAVYSPAFQRNAIKGTYVGGQFWDGRAADLTEQAKGPFLNPLEMNNPDQAAVVNSVRDSEYASLFREVYGATAFDDTATAFNNIASAIAAYEASAEVNPFTSKYDAVVAGRASFTSQEAQGFALVMRNCSTCHTAGCAMGTMGNMGNTATTVGGMGNMGAGMGNTATTMGDASNTPTTMSAMGNMGRMNSSGMGMMGGGTATGALFTDHSYRNLGVPRNPTLSYYTETEFNPLGAAWVDLGLGEVLKKPGEDGKFKVPSLRNVAITAPYTHNGYFANLRDVVRFYGTRDVATWPAPEVNRNMSNEIGNLGFTDADIDAIVAFLGTLSDGFEP